MSSPSDAPPGSPSASNLGFVEDLYFAWRDDPSSVDGPWRAYFESLPDAPGAAPAPTAWPIRTDRESGAVRADDREAFRLRVDRLTRAWRTFGHLQADLDPLGLVRRRAERLDLAEFGLGEADLDREIPGRDGSPETLRRLLSRLQETYGRTLGVQLGHIQDRELRAWLEQRMERTRNRLTLDPDVKRRLLEKLLQAGLFEQFLGTRFLGAKRFSLEGTEVLVPLLELLLDRAVGYGVRNVVIGMAHRGRLNVLANVLGKPLRDIFAEFRDQAIINGAAGGDVKYHLGYSSTRDTADGGLRLSLAFNPSHLEWIDPVVQGRVRAKQDRFSDAEGQRSIAVLVHGDAAFAGQGIVAETFNMSGLPAYSCGGTIHVVVNNQIGFTTSPRDSRSTVYCTDVALMLDIPVLHVNGEDLEAVAQAVLIAADFRQRWHRDVVIDVWGYRKYGHNEGDEPTFTQPVMYRAIAAKTPFPRAYASALQADGVVDEEQVAAMTRAYQARLEEAYQASAAVAAVPVPSTSEGVWSRYRGGPLPLADEVATAVPADRLSHVARHLSEIPAGFEPNPKIAKLFEARADMARGKRPLDWGFAEQLAYGTLAWEGHAVRLVGQDVRRGTFSHRHAVVYDQRTAAPYMPLAHLREGQGKVHVYDSLLSEAAALGFEYGYSLEQPESLVIWEAQFGDFVNGAQVLIDQFLSASEVKWNRLSGLVLLLPHGMEGQGPEHSSARLERFLELSVEDNWRVMNLTTPAQIFHALRAQVVSPWRKPLVVMSPKSLLRNPAAVSPLEALVAGRFRPVLPDAGVPDPGAVRRVVLCSGKVYYDLAEARAQRGKNDVALVRVEQLYPLHVADLQEAIAPYPAAAEVVWVQEEPRNMGAWPYIRDALGGAVRNFDARTSVVSRPPSPSPASGSATRHKLVQQALVQEALG
ncbi:MAG TPA: 2-oxoglutarate dehydrogenase E1 component [Anaeromyxobacteraceae bacterium]|nr:2-oxoglutarate dehydrogenase E1 component [Anaeromyxobacteraceae bacterium]